MVVKLESANFVLRLVRTSGQDLNTISSATGVGAVCLNLVRSIADQLDHLSGSDMLPIEATLTELLVTCLSHANADASDESTSVQLGHLRRVCRTLEARLADAELTIEDIGRMEGLSTRYVQRLFKASSTTFSEYLKERRLERCRIDLANRALAHFTVAELCYRWGFGDAANFSRAFTARFGVSPKAYRADPPKDVDAVAPLHRGRPDEGTTYRRTADGRGRVAEANQRDPGAQRVRENAGRPCALRRRAGAGAQACGVGAGGRGRRSLITITCRCLTRRCTGAT